MATIAPQIGVTTEVARSGGGENGSRLRSLLEWERTFLAEQQWHQARLSADAGPKSAVGNAPGHGTAPGEEPGRRAAGDGLLSRGVAGEPGCGEAVAIEARRTAGPQPFGGGPVGQVVAAVGGVGREIRGQAGAKAEYVQRTVCPVPLALSTPQPGALVRVDGEMAQVWLRQPGGDPSSGLEIVLQLKELLARTGLRLQRFTVNGVLKWSADEEPVVTRDNDPDGTWQVNRRV